jgi:hypothetical protein
MNRKMNAREAIQLSQHVSLSRTPKSAARPKKIVNPVFSSQTACINPASKQGGSS